MIVELGHFALILAAFVAVLQMLVPLWGAARGHVRAMAFAAPAALAQALLASASFAALTYAFIRSDFSLRLVWANSHTAKPMLYKVAGVWGNHEGSMLLWVLTLALFGGAAALFGRNLPQSLLARVLAVQASVSVAFYGFILLTSNPFLRLALPPLDGKGLNPLLQDPGLAFHPPFLYLGYVGLSMAFSFAVAALIEGRIDAAWGRWVRPWTLAAWIFLTIGIGLGSWWAYYELGWGGFWFWDPVENASFMPWLLAAALLHSAIVVEKRESLKSWTILLAILAFGFSLLGTFIVRSGVLTSVHAFATDPARGIAILAILAFFTGGALLLFSLRAGAMQAQSAFGMVSRESALVLNNLLLSVAAFVVFIGTLWPLAAEMFMDRKLSVGAPFFNTAFTPFMVLLAGFLPLGAMLGWRRGRAGQAARALLPALLVALATGALVFALQTGRSALGPVGIMLGLWLILGAVTDLWRKTGRRGRLARLLRLPGADWGKAIAHAGFGVVFIGIAGLMAWDREAIRAVPVGGQFSLGAWSVELRDVRRIDGPNYQANRAEIVLQKGVSAPIHMYPEKRYYPVEAMPTTEAALDNGVWRDLYAVLGDPQPDGSWAVRVYIKPFANWIWGGSILMALGGLFSLADRRLRLAPGRGRVVA